MLSKSILKHVAVATIGALALGSVAQAALTIDLRIDPVGAGPNDTAHLKEIAPGTLTPITIRAWAVVTGTPGNTSFEGLQSAMLAVQSQLNAAGFTGGITSGARGTGWTSGSGSQNGAASDLSTDGIGDWGSLAPVTGTLDAAAFRARTSLSRADTGAAIDFGDNGDPESPAPSPGTKNALANGGWEFRIGTFTFTPTAAPLGASVTFNPVLPTSASGGIATAGWWEDSANYNSSGTPSGARNPGTGTYSVSAANGVTISVVPEPTTLGLAGLMGLGLLRRRRA